MSDPFPSDIDFKNEMNWVRTTLNDFELQLIWLPGRVIRVDSGINIRNPMQLQPCKCILVSVDPDLGDLIVYQIHS